MKDVNMGGCDIPKSLPMLSLHSILQKAHLIVNDYCERAISKSRVQRVSRWLVEPLVAAGITVQSRCGRSRQILILWKSANDVPKARAWACRRVMIATAACESHPVGFREKGHSGRPTVDWAKQRIDLAIADKPALIGVTSTRHPSSPCVPSEACDDKRLY